MNNQQEHVQGALSIPKRPSQLSEQQLSRPIRLAVPQKRLMSISKDCNEQPEQSTPLSTNDSLLSNEVDKQSLAEMATVRLDASRLKGVPRYNAPLVRKKVRIPYPPTVNARGAKKRGILKRTSYFFSHFLSTK